MRPIAFLLLLLFSCSTAKETTGELTPRITFQLAKPQCRVDSVLFVNSATLYLELDYPGVTIRYTGDGSEVSANSRRYTGPIRINDSGVINARAFHSDYLSSETISRQFRRVNGATKNAKVEVRPEAHSAYPGNGARSLADLQKGGLGFRSDNRWLGFQSDTVLISLALEEATAVSSVTLSVLEDHGSWIFLPQRVEVLIDGKTVARREWPGAASAGNPALKFLEVPLTSATTNNIQVRVANWHSIPDWHPGSGTPPWFFIDEVLIN